MGLELHPGAQLDIANAHAWYLAADPALAIAFRRRLDSAFEKIAAHPFGWPMQKVGARRYVIRGFPFSIFYKVSETAIVVIAIAHERRRPAWFSDRL